jgi:branched-chain amino acid transport system substrate-binding protein
MAPGRLAIVFALALLGVGCVANRPAFSVNPPASARIGAALSLTGSARLFGLAQKNGIKLAQDEVNASHMLGNTRLEVIVQDDGSTRDQAAGVFQQLIENAQVLAIMGPTLSDSALTVDPLAQQAGVPVLAISNSAGGLTQIGNFVFRDSLSDSQITPQVLKAVRSKLKIHQAALLYTDTDPNRSGSHGFKKALQDMGVQIAAEQAFASDQTDFSPQLSEIVASRPDALFITAPLHLAAPILVQARALGLTNVPIIGSTAFSSDSVLHAAGGAAEGLIVGSAWSAANPSARNQQFIQAYRARFGVDPDQFAAQAYSGVYILAAALKDAGSTSDPRAVRDALERVHRLDTPLGVFSFNSARDADYLPVVQIVRQGSYQLF